MSVIYCHATDQYVDTDFTLPDQHAFESHNSPEECCGDGAHEFRLNNARAAMGFPLDCFKCGMEEPELAEYTEAAR